MAAQVTSCLLLLTVAVPAKAFFFAQSYSWETNLPNNQLVSECAKYYQLFGVARIASTDTNLSNEGFTSSQTQYDIRRNKMAIRFHAPVPQSTTTTPVCFVMDSSVVAEEVTGELVNRGDAGEVETREPMTRFVEAADKLTIQSSMLNHGWFTTAFCAKAINRGNAYLMKSSSILQTSQSFKVSGLIDPSQPELNVPYNINVTSGITFIPLTVPYKEQVKNV